MKVLLGLITLTLLFSCGDAERKTIDSELVNHTAPPALTAAIELDSDVMEVIMFSFPNKGEARDFSFTEETPQWDQAIWENMFGTFDKDNGVSLLDYGHYYDAPITKDMGEDEKIQDLIGKIMAIGEARDEAWRLRHAPLKEIETLLAGYKTKFNKEFPCFEVKKKKHPNRKKCYLQKVAGVTKKKAKKWRFGSCSGLKKPLKMYSGYKTDDTISEEQAFTFTDLDLLAEIKAVIKDCTAMEKIVRKMESLRGEGKLMVAELLGVAEQAVGKNLISKVQSQIDDVDGEKESVIEFDAEKVKFGRFQLAINFYDGNETLEYSFKGSENCKIPKKVIDKEDGTEETIHVPIIKNNPKCKITDLKVFEIGTSGFYHVDFKIQTKDFLWTTDGLSLDIDEVFGMRITGKTKLFYPDGTMRRGIIRIHVVQK